MRIRALSAAFAVLATSLTVVGISGAAQAAAPANDLIANATPLSGESGTIDGTTTDATWTVGEPEGFDPGDTDPVWTRSVWYSFTAPDDAGITFSVPYQRTGLSIGTYVSSGPGNLYQADDRHSAVGWAVERSPGVWETVSAVASVFYTDTTHDDPPAPTTYYVRVKTTAAGAGPFTLNWTEGGLPTSTTATTTVDHVGKTFRIDPATTCTQTPDENPATPPTKAAYTGYYIVRDEAGQVVGSKRRWDFYNADGTTPPTITDLPLLPGSHTYTVRFYDSTNYVYCARSQTQVTVVDTQPTTTKLKAVVTKQKITFTGSVTPAPPQGSGIQVRVGNDSVAGLLLKNGSGSYTISGVKPGKHTYIGWFESPFPAFGDSHTAPITVTVPRYATVSTLA